MTGFLVSVSGLFDDGLVKSRRRLTSHGPGHGPGPGPTRASRRGWPAKTVQANTISEETLRWFLVQHKIVSVVVS